MGKTLATSSIAHANYFIFTSNPITAVVFNCSAATFVLDFPIKFFISVPYDHLIFNTK